MTYPVRYCSKHPGVKMVLLAVHYNCDLCDPPKDRNGNVKVLPVVNQPVVSGTSYYLAVWLYGGCANCGRAQRDTGDYTCSRCCVMLSLSELNKLMEACDAHQKGFTLAGAVKLNPSPAQKIPVPQPTKAKLFVPLTLHHSNGGCIVCGLTRDKINDPYAHPACWQVLLPQDRLVVQELEQKGIITV